LSTDVCKTEMIRDDYEKRLRRRGLEQKENIENTIITFLFLGYIQVMHYVVGSVALLCAIAQHSSDFNPHLSTLTSTLPNRLIQGASVF
jgi:hypothetical protein